MEVLTLWLLLAASDGVYNRGTVVVVDRFKTANDCWAVVEKIKKQDGFSSANLICTEAKVVKP